MVWKSNRKRFWLWTLSGGEFLSFEKISWCGIIEVYTVGYDTEMCWEGLLTVSHSPNTRIIRPQILKAVPPLVQKAVKCLLLETSRVYDRKQIKCFLISIIFLWNSATFYCWGPQTVELEEQTSSYCFLRWLRVRSCLAVLNSSQHTEQCKSNKEMGKHGGHFSICSGTV